jgi:hypothetical protein
MLNNLRDSLATFTAVTEQLPHFPLMLRVRVFDLDTSNDRNANFFSDCDRAFGNSNAGAG